MICFTAPRSTRAPVLSLHVLLFNDPEIQIVQRWFRALSGKLHAESAWLGSTGGCCPRAAHQAHTDSKRSPFFVCKTTTHQAQRRQKRLQTKAGSGGGSKASANLDFVKALVETGASDESELNWSSLPYPRALLRWKTLRGDRKTVSPNSNLEFQQVICVCVYVNTIQRVGALILRFVLQR